MSYLTLSGLDALLELIQGPDVENQFVLSSNYFVKTAEYILNVEPINSKNIVESNDKDENININNEDDEDNTVSLSFIKLF